MGRWNSAVNARAIPYISTLKNPFFRHTGPFPESHIRKWETKISDVPENLCRSVRVMKTLVKPALAALSCLVLAGAAGAQQLSIEASKTVPLRLSGSASSIVVGNKNIADVAVHDERLIFVTGKSYGTTNLMVFNKAGEEIYSADVVVTANSSNLVTINRAGQNQTYDCAPVCRAALTLGDEPGYFSSLIQQQLQTQALTEGN